MIKVKAKIVIPALPSEVFSFLCDPARMAQLSPGFEIDEVTNLPGGLHRTRGHRTRPDGIVVYAEAEGVERVLDARTVVRSRITTSGQTRRITTLTTRTLTTVSQGTLLTVTREIRVSPWYLVRYASPREYSAASLALRRGLERLRTAIASSPDEPLAVDPPGTREWSAASDEGHGRSRRTKRFAAGALIAVAAVVTATVVATTSSDNSPKEVASAYVNAILGIRPEGACSLVNPAHEQDCVAYFALSKSPLISHAVACVRISGKWYADMETGRSAS